MFYLIRRDCEMTARCKVRTLCSIKNGEVFFIFLSIYLFFVLFPQIPRSNFLPEFPNTVLQDVILPDDDVTRILQRLSFGDDVTIFWEYEEQSTINLDEYDHSYNKWSPITNKIFTIFGLKRPIWYINVNDYNKVTVITNKYKWFRFVVSLIRSIW